MIYFKSLKSGDLLIYVSLSRTWEISYYCCGILEIRFQLIWTVCIMHLLLNILMNVNDDGGRMILRPFNNILVMLSGSREA